MTICQKDLQVTKEDVKQAMHEQYGGQDEPSPGFSTNYRGVTKFSNAYMLVYIRESDWNTVMCEVGLRHSVPFQMDKCCDAYLG